MAHPLRDRSTIKLLSLSAFVFSVVVSGAAKATGGAGSESHLTDEIHHRVQRILTRYSRDEICSTADAPWTVTHFLLAFGRKGMIRQGPNQKSVIPYLLFDARGREGKTLFVDHGARGVFPDTEMEPSFQYQDHHNQMLAVICEVYSQNQRIDGCPSDIPVQLWTRLLQGAWTDFSLESEPSWTLICYLSCFEQLPAPREQVLSRIDAMVRTLCHTPGKFVPACGGAHALQAISLFLSSPYSRMCAPELSEHANERLQGGLREVYRWADIYIGQGDPSEEKEQHRWNNAALILGQFGHAFEWMATWLPEKELEQPRNTRIVSNVCDLLESLEGFDISDKGALYHALRGLSLYDGRLSSGS